MKHTSLCCDGDSAGAGAGVGCEVAVNLTHTQGELSIDKLNCWSQHGLSM